MTATTTSTLTAASQSLAHLLSGTKQRPTSIRRTRQKRRQKLAEVDAARSAEEEKRRVEAAVKALKKTGKVKTKELEVRDQILEMRDAKAGKKRRGKKRKMLEMDLDLDGDEDSD